MKMIMLLSVKIMLRFLLKNSELMATEVTLNIDSLDIELISGINLTPTEAGSILKFINVA